MRKDERRRLATKPRSRKRIMPGGAKRGKRGDGEGGGADDAAAAGGGGGGAGSAEGGKRGSSKRGVARPAGKKRQRDTRE